MIGKIKECLSKIDITTTSSEELFIVDTKHFTNGGVVIQDQKPELNYVYVRNANAISIFFNGFKEYALELEVGICSKQCECVLFPETCNNEDWVLFIETKYVNNLENAFRETNNYPNCMIEQVIQTVQYFRDKGIIEKARRVNAIVSFPTLIENFSSTFFAGTNSIENILIEHRIKIRATNFAEIISQKRLKI